ncbi:MAG TPA: type II toxin-antitoxin system RelE/ParE family toxin [Clostridiales bacterium]|nr:type II toxin-antitoxin system RelE/ParE family toxin [Clostridiales bacterium]HQP68807.1 type II toxin-antitoxin system RelE/ParE family toxin [Clostridiales bacterium]
MYKITFKNSVTQDLKGIDKKQIKRILDKIAKDLADKPESCPELKGKFAGLRKFRIGDYRIIFTIKDMQTVLVLRIRHRKEVYE